MSPRTATATIAATLQPTEPGERITFEMLTSAEQARIKAFRKPVSDLATKFAGVREKLKDLAPKIIGEFNTLKAAHASLTFVDFTRTIDPSIPLRSDDKDGVAGYRNHKTYYTLNYMRGLTNLRPATGQRGSRNNAADGLARTLATVLAVLPAASHGAIWQAVKTELHFGDRMILRLKKRVADTKPLLSLKAARVTVGNVIHMEAPAETVNVPAGAPTPDLSAGRRRVRMAS